MAEASAAQEEESPIVTLTRRSLKELPLGVISAHITSLDVSKNLLSDLPDSLWTMANLEKLSASYNQLHDLPARLPPKLQFLELSHNQFSEVPESIIKCTTLEELRLGANLFTLFPSALCAMPQLKRLYLGANQLAIVPDCIAVLSNLEVLYLGGNRITYVSPAIGELDRLQVLNLGDNQLSTLPSTFSRLRSLEALALHGNALTLLPREFLDLQQLRNLSLRGNPLITAFITELPRAPPTLRELAARAVKRAGLPYSDEVLPAELVAYLDSAKRCTNPACAGVYFTAGVPSVDFVDFCGKYRVPLMRYICSPHVPVSAPPTPAPALVQQVLLTGFAPPDNDQ